MKVPKAVNIINK